MRDEINELSIVNIYETWNVNEPSVNVTGLSNYAQELLYSPAVKTELKGRAKGGIIMCNNKKFSQSKKVYVSSNCILAKIEMSQVSFILGVLYISPLTDIKPILNDLREQLNLILQEYPKLPIIIVGDFNSRILNENEIFEESLILNDRIKLNRTSMDMVLNKRGKCLLSCMEEFGLFALNGRSCSDTPAQYTYISTNRCSVADLVWANVLAINELIIDFSSYPGGK